MPKLIVSIEGVVVKEVPITKDRTTLGRRPYNDVVIDNLAVSGEHALLHLQTDGVDVEDLASTNGTFVNNKPVKRQRLHNGDTIEMGKYKIRFVDEAAAAEYEKTMLFKPGSLPPLPTSNPSRPSPLGPVLQATVRVLSGAASGREVVLQKVVTTIGKPGVAVASITKRHHGYVLAHVEGGELPHLNGGAIGDQPVTLKDQDRIELAGTAMLFMQQ